MKHVIAMLLFCAFGTITYGKTKDFTSTRLVQILSVHQQTEISALFETQEVSFGLSSRQKSMLFEFTQGEIDLRDMFFVKVAKSKSYEGLSGFDAHDLGSHPDIALPPHFGAPIAARLDDKGETDDSKDVDSMDPDLIGQWWANKYQITEVWKRATGKGVTIAACDTGFYINETDLKFNLLMEHSKDLASRNGQGRVDDGRFVFHGTAVAALMSGVRDSRGTNGIAFNARLVPLQYFNFDPALDVIDKEEATARCILHAIKIPGVQIIVVQNQTPTGSAETFRGTREAIKLALKSGINVISTAGNSSIGLTAEYLDDTGSIIVGAVHETGDRAAFSNYGPRVTVAAYGERLYTLFGPSGRMDSFGGTTAASAQVAAAVALVLEVNPYLTPEQVKEIIASTSTRTSGNRDVGGLLNILEVIRQGANTEIDYEAVRNQKKFRSELTFILEKEQQ